MRVRKIGDEEWIEISEEKFGHWEGKELGIFEKRYPIAPKNKDVFSIDETSEGCAHVYGQIIKISSLFEVDEIESIACASCKLFSLSGRSAESGWAGYCYVDGVGRFSDNLVNAAHHCDRHELAEDWKTRHGRT